MSCSRVEGAERECPDCFRKCRSAKCFDYHKKTRKSKGVELLSRCEISFKCRDCESVIERTRRNEHCCGEFKCDICKTIVLPGHLCFMQQEEPKKLNDKLLFYDFETDQSSGEHIVNFAVAQYADGTEFVFQGYESLDRFCQFLFCNEHKGYTAIAHNAKSFDAVFVQQWLIKYRPNAEMYVIHSGMKIMQLTLKDYNIRLIDSLNWLQMPLVNLPKTFGLDLSVYSKGDFPHLFNRLENQDYVGPLPELVHFSPETRSDKARQELVNWHSEMSDKGFVFNFRDEMYKYCAQDVTILRLCCLKFRELFISETKVDPFTYCTIAASVMAIYRANYLPKDTIGIIPKYLYGSVTKPYSKSSLEWLEFVAYQTNSVILHAENGGEKKIQDEELGKFYYVDGFCEKTNTVFEFNGCFYHGCPLCYDERNNHPLKADAKLRDAYTKTLEREERLKALGFNVKSIWEHDFRKLRDTSLMKEFLDRSEFVHSIDPRDAFFGGRVNGYKLFAKAGPSESIEYVDFTSLYPYVNKTKRYPIKHPTIIREDFQDIYNYFGLIKCRVLPPAKLYHPVLPIRLKGKLYFPLCKQCVLDDCNMCQHSELERSFYGTFTTVEVIRALEKGYRILEIKEVWHFEETTDSLFTEYVNFFLRLKQECSGWPLWVKTPEDQVRYIRDYFEHEGILLRHDNVKKNPGLRAMAKLCLNSLWGRFAMRTDRLITEFVNDPMSFYKLVNGADVELHDICLLTDDLVELVYKRKSEFVTESKVTNIFIGIFTTAWARLELYDLLDLVGENVLYIDTDSCIYASMPGGPKPSLGDYLGDLTNEITGEYGEGTYITDFVCAGPKNYAYRINNGKQKCKIRGFTLNYKNSKVLNFNTMKDMVINLDNRVSVKIVNESKISREPYTRRILNKREEKTYQVVYDKRILMENGQDTIPFGYHWLASNTTPTTMSSVPISLVPDHMLYTTTRYHPNDNVSSQSLNLMEVDEITKDLMETDGETDHDPSENDSDVDFVNDVEMIDNEEEASFYRRYNNEFFPLSTNFS